MRNSACLLLGFALLAATACASKRGAELESNAAVEAAIRAYLSQRSDLAMNKMEVEITHVEFQGEKAEADVIFRVKGGQGTMPFHYTLHREGDHWVVERGRSGTPTGTQMPPGHPPLGGSPPSEKLPRTGQP